MADHIATASIMHATHFGRLCWPLLLAPLTGLVGCGTLGDKLSGGLDTATSTVSSTVAKVIRPYKLEVVQGNFVSSEQVAQLKPGLTRAQVKELLGTPLMTSVFRGERWDYAFSLRRQGVEPQSRKLTVVFKGDILDHFQGDPMPTEAEFVASLDTRNKGAKPRVLEVSPEVLKALSVERTPAPVDAEQPPLPASYPPLEGDGT